MGTAVYLTLIWPLLCRLYAHTLLVLDDNDFYERQDMFTLAQQRGIATALNALVFRTYCPATSGETLTQVVVTSDNLLLRKRMLLLLASSRHCIS